MKVDIKFSSLSKEEKIELTKEVLNSSDADVRRLIGSKGKETPKDCSNCSKIEIDKNLLEMAQLANINVLSKYVRTHKLPERILEEFVKNGRDEVKIAVIDGVNFSLELLYKVLENASIKVKARIGKSKNTPIEVLKEMFNTNSDRVKNAIACSENEEMIRSIYRSESLEIRKNIARNVKTPKDILEELSRDCSLSVRYEVSKNPSTPVDVLTKMAETEKMKVVIGVASNTSSTIEILTKLVRKSNSTNCEMYEMIVKNPNSTTELIDEIIKMYLELDSHRLSAEETSFLKETVLNKKTSKEAISRIEKSSNKEISMYAKIYGNRR